jgi:hypothetical protein
MILRFKTLFGFLALLSLFSCGGGGGSLSREETTGGGNTENGTVTRTIQFTK